jgi:hypothetical protein
LSWFKIQNYKKRHITENKSVMAKDDTQKDKVNPQGQIVINYS